jgi:hypothetical protein
VGEDNCLPSPRPHSDEIDSQKLSILKAKRASDRMPEIDKWKELFKLLFPDSPIPNPCKLCDLAFFVKVCVCVLIITVYEETASTFNSFAIYMQNELPRLLEAELDSHHLESSLKVKLVDVVRNCQTSLFQKWISVEAPGSSYCLPQTNTSEIGMRTCECLCSK